MNYTLQLHGERSLYQVPPGLYELMSDISREVLRDQPGQVYQYIATYTETLLKLRSNMKKAAQVVDDVIAENRELFAYVDALGLSWVEANKHARVVQRTFRRVKCRRELKEKIRAKKEEQFRKSPIFELSPSFIEYFESLGIDYDTANNASAKIQAAFKNFKARQQMKTLDRSSTHTIEMIAPQLDISLVLEKPTFRDSKLLVYQESTSPSVDSGWYRPLLDESKRVKEKRSVASSTTTCGLVKKPHARDSEFLLVYNQTPNPSIDTAWHAVQRRSTDVSLEARRLGLYKGMSFLDEDDTPTKDSRSPTLETPLPTYFEADRSKVPMISETGQLEVLDTDVVTLFSTDTLQVSKSFVGSGASDRNQKREDKLPSLEDLGKKPSKTESETVKELFSIIEKKYSEDENVVDISKKSSQLGSVVEKTSLLPRLSKVSHIRSQKSDDEKTPPHSTKISQYSQRPSRRISKTQVRLSEEYESAQEQ